VVEMTNGDRQGEVVMSWGGGERITGGHVGGVQEARIPRGKEGRGEGERKEGWGRGG